MSHAFVKYLFAMGKALRESSSIYSLNYEELYILLASWYFMIFILPIVNITQNMMTLAVHLDLDYSYKF